MNAIEKLDQTGPDKADVQAKGGAFPIPPNSAAPASSDFCRAVEPPLTHYVSPLPHIICCLVIAVLYFGVLFSTRRQTTRRESEIPLKKDVERGLHETGTLRP